jgi:hypothetical protein
MKTQEPFEPSGRNEVIPPGAGSRLYHDSTLDSLCVRGWDEDPLPVAPGVTFFPRNTPDDGARFNSLLVACARKFSVHVHSGTFDPTVMVEIPSGSDVVIDGVVTIGPGAVTDPDVWGGWRINGATGVTIRGNGKLVLFGAGIAPRQAGAHYVGLSLAGACSNVDISITVDGDGEGDSFQAAVWCEENSVLSNVRVHGCSIENVSVGVAFAADVMSATHCRIFGNSLKGLKGENSFQGLGIVTSDVTGTKIYDNEIENAERHSIYAAGAQNTMIYGNRIRGHRSTVDPHAGIFAAIVLTRMRGGVQCFGNRIEDGYDGAIYIGQDETGQITSHGAHVFGNQVWHPRNQCAVWIGTDAPGSPGTGVYDVIVENNTVFVDSAYTVLQGQPSAMFKCWTGINVSINDNKVVCRGVTTTIYAVYLACTYDNGHTSVEYTDAVDVVRNRLIGDAGTDGGFRTILLDVGAETATSSVYFSGNRGPSGFMTFVSQNAVYGTNFTFENQGMTGFIAPDAPAIVAPSNLQDASWTAGNMTVGSAHRVTAQAGTNVACYVYTTPVTATNLGKTITYFADVVAGTATWVRLQFRGTSSVGCYFDVANGVVGSADVAVTGTIALVGIVGGLPKFRCSISTIVWGTDHRVFTMLSDDDNHLTWSPEGTEYLDIYLTGIVASAG